MKARDLVTLKMSSEGGQAVVADISKIKTAIYDLESVNRALTESIAQRKGVISNQSSEISALDREIKKVNNSIDKKIEKNQQLQAKMTDLENAGKTETKQFELLNTNIEKNIVSLQQDQASLEQLNATRAESSAQLKSLKQQQKEETAERDKNKASVKEHNNSIDKLNKSLNLSQLSVRQLRERQSELRRELSGVSKELYPEKWNELNNQLIAVEGQMKKVAVGGQNVKSKFDDMRATVTKVVTLMTVYAAMRVFQNIFREIGEFIKKAPEVAAKAEGIQKAFNKLNDTKLLSTLRRETKGLVNDVLLMQSTVKASSFGIPIQNLAKYLKFAQQRAQETGESVDYLTTSIINGIGRKSPLILDNLGISAARLKKEMAGGADIMQSTTKIVEEELTKQGDLALTTADRAAQANVKWENAQLKLGQKLIGFSSLWSRISANIADNISVLVGDIRTLTQQYKDQINAVAELETTTVPLVQRYEELRGNTNRSKDEQIELNKTMNTISQTIPGVIAEWDKYGNILSINTQKVYDFIEAEKAKLKYMNRDAIKEAEQNIDSYSAKLKKLQNDYDRGYSVKTVTNRSTGGDSYEVQTPYSKEAIAEMEANIAHYSSLLLGATETLNDFSGKSIEDQVNKQKESITKRAEFTALTKAQLDAWIKDEKNAANEYLALAKQVQSARFGADATITDEETESKKLTAQKKELDTLLTNQENAHKTELRLLEETKLNEKQTDEQHKIAVAKSDKAYYDERIAKLQEFKAKITDEKFLADIDKNIADTTDKSREQDPLVDRANVDALSKTREEQLRLADISTAALKRVQAEREENEQVHALRLQTLELSASQLRLEVLRNYSNEVQELEIADGREKEQLVRDAGDAVVRAETETIIQRKALDKIYRDSEQETRNQYGLVKLSEQIANEKAIMEAWYNAKLISESAYQQSLLDIDRKYEDEKLQAREQYGIAGVQELYHNELEQLRLKHEQELLTEEEFEQAKGQLKLKYATEFAQKIAQLTGMGVNMGAALEEAATARLEAEYAERIAAAQGNAEEVERLEMEKAQKKLDIEKEYADVQFAMKASDIIANTAVAIMTGYAQLGPIMGSIAAAMLGVTGIAQLVAADAERKKVKAMTLGSSGKSSGTGRVVVGREDGGYMDVTRSQDGKQFSALYNPNKRGFIDRPMVIVGEGPRGKSKEWVASNKLMQNPTARPIIELLDAEQRKGTVSTVDMSQMIRSRLAGFESGGFIDNSTSTNSTTASTQAAQRETSDVERETLQLLRHLKTNGVFTNLSLGSVKTGLNTLDKEDTKFTFKDK